MVVGRRNAWTRLAFVLLVILLLDAASATASYLLRHNDPPPLPPLQALSGRPMAGVDAYAWMPAAYKGWGSGDERTLSRALAALSDYESTGNEDSLGEATRAVNDDLLSRRYDPRHHREAGAEGLALSVLVRLHEATGDGNWLKAARRVFAVLSQFKDFPDQDGELPNNWVAQVDPQGYLWFSATPQNTATSADSLRHNFALFGLYDFSRATTGRDAKRAGRLFMAGALTVESVVGHLPVCPPTVQTAAAALKRRTVTVLAQQLRSLHDMTARQLFAKQHRVYLQALTDPEFATSGLRARGRVDPYLSQRARILLSRPTVVDMPRQPVDDRIAAALRHFARFDRTQDRDEVQKAGELITKVLASTRRGVVTHTTSSGEVPGDLGTAWYSAQTQGLMLSSLVRLASNTGDAVWTDQARDVFSTFSRVRADEEVATSRVPPIAVVGDESAPDALWFEELVRESGPHEHEHGFGPQITALIGIHDYWKMTGDGRAYCLFDGGSSTLLSHLDQARSQAQQDPLLAAQLTVLADITGDARFRPRFGSREE